MKYAEMVSGWVEKRGNHAVGFWKIEGFFVERKSYFGKILRIQMFIFIFSPSIFPVVGKGFLEMFPPRYRHFDGLRNFLSCHINAEVENLIMVRK